MSQPPPVQAKNFVRADQTLNWTGKYTNKVFYIEPLLYNVYIVLYNIIN